MPATNVRVSMLVPSAVFLPMIKVAVLVLVALVDCSVLVLCHVPSKPRSVFLLDTSDFDLAVRCGTGVDSSTIGAGNRCAVVNKTTTAKNKMAKRFIDSGVFAKGRQTRSGQPWKNGC